MEGGRSQPNLDVLKTASLILHDAASPNAAARVSPTAVQFALRALGLSPSSLSIPRPIARLRKGTTRDVATTTRQQALSASLAMDPTWAQGWHLLAEMCVAGRWSDGVVSPEYPVAGFDAVAAVDTPLAVRDCLHRALGEDTTAAPYGETANAATWLLAAQSLQPSESFRGMWDRRSCFVQAVRPLLVDGNGTRSPLAVKSEGLFAPNPTLPGRDGAAAAAALAHLALIVARDGADAVLGLARKVHAAAIPPRCTVNPVAMAVVAVKQLSLTPAVAVAGWVEGAVWLSLAVAMAATGQSAVTFALPREASADGVVAAGVTTAHIVEETIFGALEHAVNADTTSCVTWSVAGELLEAHCRVAAGGHATSKGDGSAVDDVASLLHLATITVGGEAHTAADCWYRAGTLPRGPHTNLLPPSVAVLLRRDHQPISHKADHSRNGAAPRPPPVDLSALLTQPEIAYAQLSPWRRLSAALPCDGTGIEVGVRRLARRNLNKSACLGLHLASVPNDVDAWALLALELLRSASVTVDNAAPSADDDRVDFFFDAEGDDAPPAGDDLGSHSPHLEKYSGLNDTSAMMKGANGTVRGTVAEVGGVMVTAADAAAYAVHGLSSADFASAEALLALALLLAPWTTEVARIGAHNYSRRDLLHFASQKLFARDSSMPLASYSPSRNGRIVCLPRLVQQPNDIRRFERSWATDSPAWVRQLVQDSQQLPGTVPLAPPAHSPQQLLSGAMDDPSVGFARAVNPFLRNEDLDRGAREHRALLQHRLAGQQTRLHEAPLRAGHDVVKMDEQGPAWGSMLDLFRVRRERDRARAEADRHAAQAQLNLFSTMSMGSNPSSTAVRKYPWLEDPAQTQSDKEMSMMMTQGSHDGGARRPFDAGLLHQVAVKPKKTKGAEGMALFNAPEGMQFGGPLAQKGQQRPGSSSNASPVEEQIAPSPESLEATIAPSPRPKRSVAQLGRLDEVVQQSQAAAALASLRKRATATR
jgi:hypothetical protein